MADINETWQSLKVLVESLEVDIKKTASGNKTAGVRARKGLRLLKQSAADLIKVTIETSKTQE